MDKLPIELIYMIVSCIKEQNELVNFLLAFKNLPNMKDLSATILTLLASSCKPIQVWPNLEMKTNQLTDDSLRLILKISHFYKQDEGRQIKLLCQNSSDDLSQVVRFRWSHIVFSFPLIITEDLKCLEYQITHLPIKSLELTRANLKSNLGTDILASIVALNPEIKCVSLKWSIINPTPGNIAKILGNLQEFDLSYGRIGPSIAACVSLCINTIQNLRVLNLSHNDIGDEGAKYFSDYGLGGLESLDLSGNHLSRIDELINCISKSKLKTLNLSRNRLDPTTFSSKELTCLKELFLIDVGLGKSSLSYLLQATRLKRLDISENSIDLLGIKVIVRCEPFTIEHLAIRHSRFGLEGVKLLLLNGWKSLKNLDVKGNGLSQVDKWHSMRDLNIHN